MIQKISEVCESLYCFKSRYISTKFVLQQNIKYSFNENSITNRLQILFIYIYIILI